jgi:hypothetical protein
MTRSPSLWPTIVASALSTALLLPFSCAGLSNGFDGVAGSGDDVASGDERERPATCEAGVCPQDTVAVDACTPLRERTCGACAASASCEAATLLARYEPERCADALVDEQRFPTCTARPCDGLMKQVCGDTTPTEACRANPGCGPAEVLYERATSPLSTTDEIAQAEASCAKALTDDAVFAPCGA